MCDGLFVQLDNQVGSDIITVGIGELAGKLAGKLRVNDDFRLSAQRTDKKTISTTRSVLLQHI